MLSERCPVLSVCNFGVLCQMIGQIKMKLGVQVGLDHGHIVLDGDPAPPKETQPLPQFLAHVCCG